ncbi:MAG TPA: c-type cytochrome [Methylophilaceae bacterium]|nr:c-type cytochrome [Methylophilaceae bacterium]
MSEQLGIKLSLVQIVFAMLAALLVPALIIYMVVKLVVGIQVAQLQDAHAAATAAQIEQRIKPVASVDVAGAHNGTHVDKSGEAVYTAVCAACHASGMLGSPKFGDKAAWAPRIAEGYDTLVKHAIEGIRMMPARGGNSELTDGEVANAVAYMANKAGATFTPPAAEAAAPAPEPEIAAVADTTTKPAADSVTPAASSAGQSGEQVVKAVCMTCHGAGLMGAPKIGDKSAWAPRIAEGYDTLVQHAINGIRMMPAKGGNPSLTDAEVAAAVAHMANQSGAQFKAPE